MKGWLALALWGAGSLSAGAQAAPPQHFAELHECRLENGSTIHNCRLGYRTWGTLNAAKSNAVLVPMWFTGRSGDMAAQIGAGKLIDPAQYFIVAVDPFGNGVSSSPSNSSAQPGLQFPQFTIRDMVEAEHRLVTQTLQLPHLRAVLGISMGGMQTFEWVVDYPQMMDVAIPIVGSPQLSSYDLMLWNLEKAALESDEGYAHGHYTQHPALPLVAYIHSMHQTTPQFRVDHVMREQFAAYWAQVAVQQNITSDANDYLRQLQAMIAHDISHGGTLYDAAAKIKTRMLIINAQQDQMVNPIPALGFAKLLHAPTLVLESDCGHAAPACEQAKIIPAVTSFLASR